MSTNITTLKKIVLIILIIGFIASMLPLLYISKLNHPYRDDFSYSILTHNTYVSTNSIAKVLGAAAKQVKDTYTSWQGTYSSVYLFSLNPALFKDGMYQLTTYILFFVFICGNLFFMYTLLVKTLKIKVLNYLIISLAVILISIQFVPSPFNAFYWYNGGIHYVFFYSLELTLLGIILLMLTKDKKHSFGLLSLSVIITMILGGGNFVTALNLSIILFLATLYLLLTKNKKWSYTAIIFTILIICLPISALAPGNAVRASHFTGYGVVKSIRLSLDCGLKYIFTMFNAPKGTILCIILALIAVLPLMSKVIANNDYKFRFSIVFILLLYGLLSAMFTPQFYGLGDKGPIRIENIIFFSLIIYLFASLVYVSGWLYKKVKEIISLDINKFSDRKGKIYLIYLSIIAILFSLNAYTIIDNKKNQMPTSIEAFNSIVNGEAYAYHFQNLDRIIELESDKENIVLEPITVHPSLLSIGDFVDERYEKYYNKESVTLREEIEEIDDNTTVEANENN